MIDKKSKDDDLINSGIAGANYEIVQRYGSAAHQHYVAYSGIDNETEKKLVKGLKKISEERINPQYAFQNIQQQAGYSAEVKEVAKFNSENIIKKNPIRKIRVDDVGKVNDPLYDTVLVKSNGEIIEKTEAQMKFLGASQSDPEGKDNSKRSLQRLKSKKMEKYINQDLEIDVPSDQYGKIIEKINEEIEKLTKQLEYQKKNDNISQIDIIQKKIDKLQKIKKNLRPSVVTSKEAVEARLHPKISTAKDIVKISHRAGIEAAGTAAIISGSISIIKNLVSICKKEVEAKDALFDISKDISLAATVGYGTGFSGAALKGAMQNSSQEYLRTLSKTNVAGTVAAVSVSATKTFIQYFNGEIDGVECIEILGEQGTGMISSAMFSVIGQLSIPIPVIGGMIGGMLGYTLSSATYGILIQSLKEEKLAQKERIAVENACKEYIQMIREYRAEVENIINKYLLDSMDIFRESFAGIQNALAIGDTNWFIDSSNQIIKSFGGQVTFSSMEEFNSMMMKKSTFKL